MSDAAMIAAQSSEAAHAQALALVERYEAAMRHAAGSTDDPCLRRDLLDALSEKLDLEVSQSQPGADVGPIAHARTEAEPSAAWQPIETAPRDGTRFLTVVDGEVRVAAWGKTSHVPIYGFCLADQGVEDFDVCTLSLWMPLPEAPK